MPTFITLREVDTTAALRELLATLCIPCYKEIIFESDTITAITLHDILPETLTYIKCMIATTPTSLSVIQYFEQHTHLFNLLET
jgi:hypothetical protein